jgi:hypothetical protein
MRFNCKFIFIAGALLCTTCFEKVSSQNTSAEVKHLKIYHEKGMYAGWPANNGIWIWGNEILTGFSKAHHKDMGSRHNIDRENTEIHVLARSLDGGETWKIEDPAKNGLLPEAMFGHQRTDIPYAQSSELKTAINFKHPEFALTARLAKKDKSSFWYSYDKGHHWNGPFSLPTFGTSGMEARTDYIVDSNKDAFLFLTVPKKNGKEGRVICVKTNNGGKKWDLVSWIGEEPEGFSIMPASVRLSSKEILVTTRDQLAPNAWISTYYSRDNGKSWENLGKAVEDAGIGNPPAMIKMKDGRLCLIYGYRSDPESNKTSDIRARLSSDNGRTWSSDFILRNDGAGRDIGYPRVVQRPDGKIVAVYYFTDKETGPERYIGATIWAPPAKNKLP